MIKKLYSISMVFFVLLFASTCIGESMSPQLTKSKVQAAAELLKSQGDAALAAIKDPNGEFRFGDGKGYVWVHNLDGIMVMHPIKPSLDGKGLFNLKDSAGRYYFVAFNEMVEENGAGWVPYSWPKPGEENESPKVSYVKGVKHGDKTYIVGSGMYGVTGPDIQKAFPGKTIYSVFADH
ncbi:MAG: cache domain-containing protein [Desulfobacteraceae bacterium]|nr:cache domain-containing protein [Desulfobacteraceae bacterium]